MKSYINKFLMGAALVAATGLGSCTGDLDQLPKDPGVITPSTFAQNPSAYLEEVMAKCYAGIATSGSKGRNDSADLEGMDGGTSQFTRATFYLNEFPADECLWIYMDGGVEDLLKGTWSDSNELLYGFYSRYYVEIAMCNDFLRLTTPESLSGYGISVDAALQAEIDQYRLEARALRAMAYYNVIDFWGAGQVAWDDQSYGEVPPQAESRAALYQKVVADLEDVLASFPSSTPVYSRVGKDGIEALLAKFYLNAEVWNGAAAWDKCWTACQNIISRHQGGGYQGSGLVMSYHSLFCGNNDMFMPGGSLPSQNEILWGVPYEPVLNEPWGGNVFALCAPLWGNSGKDMQSGFCNSTYYGTTAAWGSLHATKEMSQKFGLDQGPASDIRAALWMTDAQGWRITNDVITEALDGFPTIKYSNVLCNADGTMDYWNDPTTGIIRIGQHNGDVVANLAGDEPDTDLPILRLADIYLMAAECTLHGQGDVNTGVTYVNYVRGRAGASAWTANQLNAQNLIDERARELYNEGFRRQDLIRFGLFTGSKYVWSWKGGTLNGASLADTRALYPLPANVTAIYGDAMTQNPGYGK